MLSVEPAVELQVAVVHIPVAVSLSVEGAPRSVVEAVVYIAAAIHLTAPAAPLKLTVDSLSAGVVSQLKLEAVAITCFAFEFVQSVVMYLPVVVVTVVVVSAAM